MLGVSCGAGDALGFDGAGIVAAVATTEIERWRLAALVSCAAALLLCFTARLGKGFASGFQVRNEELACGPCASEVEEFL